jgi:hypothetical protein
VQEETGVRIDATRQQEGCHVRLPSHDGILQLLWPCFTIALDTSIEKYRDDLRLPVLQGFIERSGSALLFQHRISAVLQEQLDHVRMSLGSGLVQRGLAGCGTDNSNIGLVLQQQLDYCSVAFPG